MKLKHILYTVIISLFFYACAQTGSLSGGERDTVPPVYVKGKPEHKSLNFEGDKIIITFDEFFQLNNLNQVFISSPPFSEKPDFNLKRKSLVVNFKGKLHDTTTYTMWFGNAVEDFHERNPLEDFRFVFSTGNHLDTMEISGKVKDAFNMDGIENMFVMLYTNYNDSSPINEQPFYIAKTDTSGSFMINYIKPGNYRIFALKDVDANFNFNLPNEKIAYLDSFIVPEVKADTKIDSLKAGTVLHIGEKDHQGDTLLHDTVIITNTSTYSPKNLQLFAFLEDKQKQYIVNAVREMKGKCSFEFSKPADSAKISGLNFILEDEKIFKEVQDSSRKIIYWFKDNGVYNIDTLKFKVDYLNVDSVGNNTIDSDTFKLFFDLKKDSLNRYLNFENVVNEHDSFSSFKLELQSPVNLTDTNKIKLYRIHDTLTVDTKKQGLIKSIRPEPNKFQFVLRRPFINLFELEALNVDTTENWYIKTVSGNDSIIDIEIKDKLIFETDTIKMLISYDNRFFYDQIQTFHDTIDFSLFKQGVLSIERPATDTLIINFKKGVSEDTRLTLPDINDDTWYEKIDTDHPDKLIVKINDSEQILKDTLTVTIRTNDYDNTLGDKIYYEYSKRAVYTHVRQELKTIKRSHKERFILVFTQKLGSDISITPVNNTGNSEIETVIGGNRDTVYCSIKDKSLSRKDTLHFRISYDYIQRDRNTAKEIDTISVVYKKARRSKSSRAKATITDTDQAKKTIVSIEIPEEYEIKTDSLSERISQILYNWKPQTEYILKLDSGAFIDIYKDKSKKQDMKFKVRDKDFYGRIILNLSNISRIADKDFYVPEFKKDTSLISMFQLDSFPKDSLILDSLIKIRNEKLAIDSAQNSKLKKGQLMVYLSDKDHNYLDVRYVTEDEQIIFDRLVPESYYLKFIYDINKNKKWDTGNFLKNIQPERVLIYPGAVILKSNMDHIVDWIINTPK